MLDDPSLRVPGVWVARVAKTFAFVRIDWQIHTKPCSVPTPPTSSPPSRNLSPSPASPFVAASPSRALSPRPHVPFPVPSVPAPSVPPARVLAPAALPSVVSHGLCRVPSLARVRCVHDPQSSWQTDRLVPVAMPNPDLRLVPRELTQMVARVRRSCVHAHARNAVLSNASYLQVKRRPGVVVLQGAPSVVAVGGEVHEGVWTVVAPVDATVVESVAEGVVAVVVAAGVEVGNHVDEQTKGEQGQKRAAVGGDGLVDGHVAVGGEGAQRNGKGERWELVGDHMYVSVDARVQGVLRVGVAFLWHALRRGIRHLVKQRRTLVCARVDNAL